MRAYLNKVLVFNFYLSHDLAKVIVIRKWWYLL